MSASDSCELAAMTRNRTALDVFASLGTQMMVLLLLVLAFGVGMMEYFALVRERMRRLEVRLRRRAARRVAA